jgi:predicted N-acyltransferase
MGQKFDTRVVRTVDELSEDVASLAHSSGANFNYGREFMRAYEFEPIQPVYASYYIEVRDEQGTLVAFTPCYIQGDPLGALGIKPGERGLLSHVWHCSDSRLVSNDVTVPLAVEVMSTMRDIAAAEGVPRYGFINVATGSPSAMALEGAGVEGIYVDTRYAIDLASLGDEEGYLASLRSGPRAHYRRHWRRADEAGMKVSHRFATDDIEPEYLELLETSMERVGSAGYYSKERISAFLGMTPSARLIELTLDDELIGMSILFVEPGKRIHAWAGGWVRERKFSFSPYYVLMGSCLRLGFQLGLPRLEGGRRNGEYKMRYGMTPQTLNAYVTDV